MEDNEGEINTSQNDPLISICYSGQPGDIYYMNPPKELNTYPMYIDNPQKVEKTVGSYISYSFSGTDITEKLSRRYSDFFNLYEKLLQRWPGIYIPRIPQKKTTGNKEPSLISKRIRLINRFCLNLSNIEYLYKCEEVNIFRSNIKDVANAISKLPELKYSEILIRMKEAFPEYNENYDIIIGRSKITEFNTFLKKCSKNIEEFKANVNIANDRREAKKTYFLKLIHDFTNYEKDNIISYANNNEDLLIFYNHSLSSLSEKVLKLKNEITNPFVAFKYWLDEETLDVKAMQIAIEQINNLLETEHKLKVKLSELEEDIKKGQAGQVNIFKSLFKKKEDIVSKMEKDKEETEQKINDIGEIIKIVGDNMEKQIEIFKAEKTQNYYKYLKMFAILERESNKVIRELWTLVKNALNDISPNVGKNEEYISQPMNKHSNEDFKTKKNEDELDKKEEEEENRIEDKEEDIRNEDNQEENRNEDNQEENRNEDNQEENRNEDNQEENRIEDNQEENRIDEGEGENREEEREEERENGDEEEERGGNDDD